MPRTRSKAVVRAIASLSATIFFWLDLGHLSRAPLDHQKSTAEMHNHNAKPVFVTNQVWLELAQQFNFLPNSEDKEVMYTRNRSLPFSIRYEDFVPHNTRYCETVDELLQAIANGKRKWKYATDNSTFLQKEQTHSSFIPYHCDVPLHSPDQICDILNQFSHVVMQGDSLSRHQQGSLLMNLRDNVYNGGIQSSKPEMQRCIGDAQFSEDVRCRGNDGLFNSFRPSQLDLCPNLSKDDQFTSVFNINRLHRGVYKFPGVNCTNNQNNNTKPLLIIAQGGVHMGYQASATFRSLLAPFFRDFIVQQCSASQHHRVIFIFVSYHAQSIAYDEKYPDQAESNGLQFNANIQSIINGSGVKNVTTIDWFNFTKGAMHTDGLHFAAQVNYFKVQHIVALADLMVREQQWLDLENFTFR
ncbi:hypothetical protein ACHAWO_004453 [Cyclotella atomus]|jgi:hypothetical protein|uniref:Uncharacterized protein n=1 Tax=Cyclotella atomus TaxID=382360 RepID=A0ABD3NYC1_9STRA